MRNLFLAEFKRSVTLFVRYPSEAITMIVTFTAIFLGLFLGARALVGSFDMLQSGQLDSIIVSYILWSLTLFALGSMGWSIQMEAQTGTLEQVFLAPFGPRRVFIIRALAELSLQLGLIAVVLGIIMLITGSRPHFSLSIIPPVITIMLATYGLGFVIGGLTLLFKRIQNVLQLSQFALLFLVMAPVETWQGFLKYAAYLLPLTPSAGMLRELMARNAAFNTGDFAVALVNGIVYFALGLLFFTWADRTAKHRGLLGGY